MHKLTSSELADIEQRLRSMRADIGERIRTRLHAAYGDDSPVAGAAAVLGGEHGPEDTLDEDQIALIAHELDELNEVDAALLRIEFNVGGVCTDCGNDIAYERLRAMPSAATCIECAGRPARCSGAASTMHVN
jgi:DnaK suppressor protein